MVWIKIYTQRVVYNKTPWCQNINLTMKIFMWIKIISWNIKYIAGIKVCIVYFNVLKVS